MKRKFEVNLANETEVVKLEWDGTPEGEAFAIIQFGKLLKHFSITVDRIPSYKEEIAKLEKDDGYKFFNGA